MALQKTVLYSPPSVAYGGAYSIRPPIGHVWGFKKRICIRHRRWRLWGVCDTPLRPSTCDSLKYRCDPPTGHVRPFEIPMQFSNRVRARVQKTDLYTPLSVAYGGAYSICPYNRVRAALQKTIPFSSPSRPRDGRMRYAPTIGYVRSFEIPM